jgi:hypothetical protein
LKNLPTEILKCKVSSKSERVQVSRLRRERDDEPIDADAEAHAVMNSVVNDGAVDADSVDGDGAIDLGVVALYDSVADTVDVVALDDDDDDVFAAPEEKVGQTVAEVEAETVGIADTASEARFGDDILLRKGEWIWLMNSLPVIIVSWHDSGI